jgi:predicted phosphohydrolase
MDIFGGWQDYVSRLESNWKSLITDDDTVVIPGDISWAMSLEGALEDFRFIHNLPGKKIILKGNHDLWWSTVKKLREFFEQNDIDDIEILFNNTVIAEGYAIAGTRGWFYDASCDNIPPDTDFAKIVAREEGRLRLSLEEGKKLKALHPEKQIVAFLHFPAVWLGKRSEEILSVLKEYEICECYFGHVHGNYELPMEFVEDSIHFSVTSADFLHFTPKLVRSHKLY